MTSPPLASQARAPGQRGFALLDAALGLAILSTLLVATAATYGLRPPRAHAAAVALEAALAEARSLATSTADQTDPAFATGATVYVARDPADARRSVIAVYRSRPIINSNPGAGDGPLSPDVGFPPQSVAATFSVSSGGGAPAEPFALLVSSSGYASVAAPMASDPGKSVVALTSDPGCSDGAVTIVADDGVRRESHPFACRGALYDASR